jgi:hypothetical protein
MDIAVIIDPIEHIRRRKEMYVPGGHPDPIYPASRLAGDALLLGATRVEMGRSDEWWWVAADFDWISSSGVSDQEIFSRVVPLPEAGANSMRGEVLLTAFASAVVTVVGNTPRILAGPEDLKALRLLASFSSGRPRLVGFRMEGH